MMDGQTVAGLHQRSQERYPQLLEAGWQAYSLRVRLAEEDVASPAVMDQAAVAARREAATQVNYTAQREMDWRAGARTGWKTAPV